MVEFKNTSFNYSKQSGVYDINLSINENEFCFLVGPTGSGKTSLLKLMYFDIIPSKGEVNILGFNSKKTKLRNVHKLRKKIGVIFQDYKLLQQRTVYENIALPLHINGLGRTKIKENVSEALELTDLTDFQSKYPHQLSGGEQQRVCIARAIVKNPEIILADEPTGNLDKETSISVMNNLVDICKENEITLITVSHDENILSLSNNHRMISMGKLILSTS